MPLGRPRRFEIVLTPETRAQLETVAHSRSLPAGLVRRAQVILLSATGTANREIGAAVRLSAAMVGHWRRRFQARGLAGLYDAPRSGRPRTHDDDRPRTSRWPSVTTRAPTTLPSIEFRVCNTAVPSLMTSILLPSYASPQASLAIPMESTIRNVAAS